MSLLAIAPLKFLMQVKNGLSDLGKKPSSRQANLCTSRFFYMTKCK